MTESVTQTDIVATKHKELIVLIGKSFEECEFLACRTIAYDLLHLSSLFGLRNGILHGEIMYHVSNDLLELVREYGINEKDENLTRMLKSYKTLAETLQKVTDEKEIYNQTCDFITEVVNFKLMTRRTSKRRFQFR